MIKLSEQQIIDQLAQRLAGAYTLFHHVHKPVNTAQDNLEAWTNDTESTHHVGSSTSPPASLWDCVAVRLKKRLTNLCAWCCDGLCGEIHRQPVVVGARPASGIGQAVEGAGPTPVVTRLTSSRVNASGARMTWLCSEAMII
jgi:hypothetical protein